jgi:hypothetical protein
MNSADYAMFQEPGFLIAFAVLGIWSLIWKGFALWRAARDESKVWFVILLLVNTLGVLEIVYLFAISPMRKKLRGK